MTLSEVVEGAAHHLLFQVLSLHLLERSTLLHEILLILLLLLSQLLLFESLDTGDLLLFLFLPLSVQIEFVLPGDRAC